jgi:hypothetical protein
MENTLLQDWREIIHKKHREGDRQNMGMVYEVFYCRERKIMTQIYIIYMIDVPNFKINDCTYTCVFTKCTRSSPKVYPLLKLIHFPALRIAQQINLREHQTPLGSLLHKEVIFQALLNIVCSILLWYISVIRLLFSSPVCLTAILFVPSYFGAFQ